MYRHAQIDALDNYQGKVEEIPNISKVISYSLQKACSLCISDELKGFFSKFDNEEEANALLSSGEEDRNEVGDVDAGLHSANPLRLFKLVF